MHAHWTRLIGWFNKVKCRLAKKLILFYFYFIFLKQAIGSYNVKEWLKASDQIKIQVTSVLHREGMVEAHDQLMIQAQNTYYILTGNNFTTIFLASKLSGFHSLLSKTCQ